MFILSLMLAIGYSIVFIYYYCILHPREKVEYWAEKFFYIFWGAFGVSAIASLILFADKLVR